jgi:hypothetical protein
MPWAVEALSKVASTRAVRFFPNWFSTSGEPLPMTLLVCQLSYCDCSGKVGVLMCSLVCSAAGVCGVVRMRANHHHKRRSVYRGDARSREGRRLRCLFPPTEDAHVDVLGGSVRRHTGGVEPGRGGLLEVENVAHLGAIGGAAVLVEEEAAVRHASHLMQSNINV